MTDEPVECRKPSYDELYTSFGAMQNELMAMRAAIRALPRYQIYSSGEGTFVNWSALARLLGDPAQEQS